MMAAWPVQAERRVVYSLLGVANERVEAELRLALESTPGIQKVEFRAPAAELYVRMDDAIADGLVLEAIAGAGYRAVVGAGKGSYAPLEAFARDADVSTLSADGTAVGPLERLRVKGRYTVFLYYALWSTPCRDAHQQLRELLELRTDVAVRLLNVVDLESPLARELGPDFDTLPHLVVFQPTGRRVDLSGSSPEALQDALR